jgi:hypothetical protein
VNQRDEDLLALPAHLAQILPDQRGAHVITFHRQLALKQTAGQALLGGRARLPLLHQLVQSQLHPLPYRPLSSFITPPHWLWTVEVFPHRDAA